MAKTPAAPKLEENHVEAKAELDKLAAEDDAPEDNPLTVFASQLQVWHETDAARIVKVVRYRTMKAMDPDDGTLSKLVESYSKDRQVQMELEKQMRDTLREIVAEGEKTLEELLTSGHMAYPQSFPVPDILKKKLAKAVPSER